MHHKINILLADTQQLFAEGFTAILNNIQGVETNVIGYAASGQELIDAIAEEQIDMIFMDINFPDLDGVELITNIKSQDGKTRVCVVSSYTDHKLVKKAFLAGADGYFSKSNNSDELFSCVTQLLEGDRFLSEGVYITPPQRQGDAPVKTNGTRKSYFQDKFLIQQKLTKREQEVLNLITKALNNKEIADRLYISHQTVGVHRKNIMRKLGVRNTVNLIRFALDHELIS